MHTATLEHHPIVRFAGPRAARIRGLDFVLVAFLAVLLAIVVRSDRAQDEPAPPAVQPS